MWLRAPKNRPIAAWHTTQRSTKRPKSGAVVRAPPSQGWRGRRRRRA